MDNDSTYANSCNISLREFLDGVFDFETLPEDEAVCLTVAGADGSWGNFPVTERRLNKYRPGSMPWYFGVSTFAPPAENGWFPRGRAHARFAYCIVCDDVGTKARWPPVPPSWVLESSEGNYQVGYIIDPLDLSVPENVALYEGSQKALADARYCDAGARGVYRVMRIPGSLHSSGFTARVTEWHPERVWTLEELMAELDLRPAKLRVQRPKPGGEGVALDQVQDPILDWLVERGHTTGVVGPKFVEVLCPWREEHTTGEGVAGYTPVGYDPGFDHAFSCLHEHCAGRGKKDFLAWVEAQGGPVGGGGDGGDGSGEGGGEPVRLTRELLPDCQWGQKGPAKRQLATDANLEAVADAVGLDMRLDVMSNQIVTAGGESQNALLLRFSSELARVGIENLRMVELFLDVRSAARSFSPFDDWLGGLPKWDGVDRVALLRDSVETPTPLWPMYLRKWLVQVVYAGRAWRSEQRPLSHVLVFSGRQGIGKSHWFSSLLPRHFFKGEAELHLSGTDSKDQQLSALRHPLVELGEIDSTFRKSDIAALKSFLTRPVDELRAPYGRLAIPRNRGTVFCGTVNDPEFLHDPTGARRFWPVQALSFDWNLQLNLEQLWSQVVSMVDVEGETPELNKEQAKAQEADADEFRQLSVVEVAFCDYFNEDWMGDHGADDLMPVQADELLAVLDISPSERRHQPNRGEATRLLENRFGKRRTIAGKQRCFMVPVKKADRQHVNQPRRWLEEAGE